MAENTNFINFTDGTHMEVKTVQWSQHGLSYVGMDGKRGKVEGDKVKSISSGAPAGSDEDNRQSV